MRSSSALRGAVEPSLPQSRALGSGLQLKHGSKEHGIKFKLVFLPKQNGKKQKTSFRLEDLQTNLPEGGTAAGVRAFPKRSLWHLSWKPGAVGSTSSCCGQLSAGWVF